MAQYINTNISALNSQRNLSMSQTALATSLQRLSSGLRINSAKDDAAGLAISNRMTSQINGLTQAARNANDGISLAQTAEGAMNEISNNLQRMRDLSVQSANASSTTTDRVSINNEIQQLSAEIQRVAASTSFNGTKLLDGTFNAQSFQVGANQGEVINITSITNMQTTQLGSSGTSFSASVTGGVTTKALAAGNLTLNGFQVGASLAGAAPGQSAGSAYSISTAINAVSASTGVTATANATSVVGGTTTLASSAVAANKFSINGINVGAITAGGSAAGQGANVAAAINAIAGQTGVSASANATTGAVTLAAADGRNINVTASTGYSVAQMAIDTGLTPITSDTATAFAAVTATTAISLTVNGATVTGTTAATALAAAQSFVTAFNAAAAVAGNAGSLAGISASADAAGVISLTSNGTLSQMALTTPTTSGFVANTYSAQHGTVTLSSTSANGIVQAGGAATNAGFTGGTGLTTNAVLSSTVQSISSLTVLTASSSQSAITAIDGALAIVDTARGALGAYQNRFASAVSNMQTAVENLSASRSRIQDTDFAHETAQLTRAQILQQAGTAMLAQANAVPNGVMALLR
jgi:flagellin